MSNRGRIVVAAVAVVLLAGVAVGYVRYAAGRAGSSDSAPGGSAGVRVQAGQLLFRSTAAGPGYGHIAALPLDDLAGSRKIAKPTCTRVYAAAATAGCIRPDPESIGTYQIAVLDRRLRFDQGLPLVGVPSRTRVSPSGRMVAWTVFVTGDSYNGGKFSTRSGILDTRTGDFVATLEEFTVYLGGHRYSSVDLNFWGVTFAADDNEFYATMSTRGRTYLVRGDLRKRTVRTLRSNLECPSLSPDGKRLAFKKRVGGDSDKPWRLYVLDLATMQELPLSERRSVDDQAAWLDDDTVAYGILRGDRHSDIWAVPADGSGSPRKVVRDGESPAPVLA